MRTLTPSVALARKAIVVLVPSNAVTRGLTTSATFDSVIPQTRRNRLRIIAFSPERRTRSGSTDRSSISRISDGTPGTA